MTNSPLNRLDDLERIRQVYRPRTKVGEFFDPRSWNVFEPGLQFNESEYRDLMISALRTAGCTWQWVEQAKILEMGCGWGRNSYLFMELGFSADQIHGIDLMEHFVMHGKKQCPGLNLIVGSGTNTSFASESFDLILFHTVFSAVFDGQVHEDLLKEASRLLRPDGLIVIYDILGNYKTHTNKDAQEYIRPLSPQSIFKMSKKWGLQKSQVHSCGLRPRFRSMAFYGWLNIIRRKLGIKMKPPSDYLARRSLAAFLALWPWANSHFFMTLKKEKTHAQLP